MRADQVSLRARLLVETLVVVTIACLPAVAHAWLVLADRDLSSGEQIVNNLSVLGVLVLLAYFVWRNGERWTVLGLRRTSWWREVAWGVALCALAYLISHVAETWSDRAGLPEHPAVHWEIPHVVWLDYLLWASYEEFLFRGYLWTRVQQITSSNLAALIVTSLLFALGHDYPLRGLLWVFAFGLAFGWCYWCGRSTPRLILGHWAFNLTLHYAP